MIQPIAPQEPPRLISVEEVKQALTKSDPDYGKDFTENEWGHITERLSALARLYWRMAEQELREEQQTRTTGQSDNHPAHLPGASD